MPRKMKVSDWIKHDKVHSAVHEAGHAVVSLKLGAPWTRLTQVRDLTRNVENQIAFIARCHVPPIKGKVNNGAQGFAGAIAETLYRDGLELDVEQLYEYFDLEVIELSSTDKEMIGPLRTQHRLKAIGRALEILKVHWLAVRGIAFLLHDNPEGEITILPEILEQKQWRGFI